MAESKRSIRVSPSIRAGIDRFRSAADFGRGVWWTAALLGPALVAILVWVLLDQKNRIDLGEAERKQIQAEVERVKRDCQHVSPERMRLIDTTLNRHEKDLDGIAQKLRRRR